jgi:hypothetical protein
MKPFNRLQEADVFFCGYNPRAAQRSRVRGYSFLWGPSLERVSVWRLEDINGDEAWIPFKADGRIVRAL